MMMRRSLLTMSNSKSIVAEQFHIIRTNIKFSVPDIDLKTILVTSSTPGEGKSTNAADLAVVFAQEGKKVLIIDADMRKPTMHQTFGIFNTVGLSTVLSKQHELINCIQKTDIDGLFILPSGPTPPNPAELLSSKVFGICLKEVKNSFDLIIFDAPLSINVDVSMVCTILECLKNIFQHVHLLLFSIFVLFLQIARTLR